MIRCLCYQVYRVDKVLAEFEFSSATNMSLKKPVGGNDFSLV